MIGYAGYLMFGASVSDEVSFYGRNTAFHLPWYSLGRFPDQRRPYARSWIQLSTQSSRVMDASH
jgi:hypothetical protein